LKVSGDSPVIVPKENPAGKTAGKADSFTTDSLHGKPGRALSNVPGLGQTRPNIQDTFAKQIPPDIRDTPTKQMPPGSLPEKALANLISLLKLPQDGLSRAIVTFARFFSLPLEPKLLAALRREALGSRATGREAAALAAAAAADKGINLSERALAEYAAAIKGGSFAQEDAAVPASTDDPQKAGNHSSHPEDQQANDTAEREPGQEPGNQEAGTGNENNNRNSGGSRNKPQPGLQGKSSPLFDRPLGNNLLDGSKELQHRITEILEEKPFLDLINRIPGKNGQWIVVPFSFSEDGLDFTVSLHILINKEAGKALVSGRLSADIKVSRLGQEQKRWLVILERSEENTKASAELSVFSGSGPWRFSAAEKKQIRLELAAALDVPLDKVSIREASLTSEAILVFTGSKENALRSVNEEV